MLGVIPGSFSRLRSEARFRSTGAGVAGAWRRWKRLHAGARSTVASASAASRAGARVMGPRSLPCLPPSTKEAAEPFAQAPARRSDGAAAAAHGAADLLADGRPRLPVERARLLRLRPGEEGLAAGDRASRGGKLAGFGIDVAPHDVLGHREVALARLAARGAHEVGPDGERSLRAREPGRPAAVEPHPDAGHHLGREADEPRVAGVVGRARLARGRAGEARLARGTAGAAVDHALEEMGDEIGDAWGEDALLFRRRGVERLAVGGGDGDDERRGPAQAAAREIGRAHV